MEDAQLEIGGAVLDVAGQRTLNFVSVKKLIKKKLLYHVLKENIAMVQSSTTKNVDFFASENQEGILYLFYYVNLKNVPFL